MTTKIYDGLRAVSSDPFEVARQTKAVIEPLFFKQVKRLTNIIEDNARNSLQDVFDLPEPLDEPQTSEKKIFAVIDFLYRYPSKTSSTGDVGYEIILMRSARGDDRILGLLVSEKSIYRKALIEAGVFKEYGYWDNSKAKKGVSEAAWKRRGQSWSELTKNNTPASIGLAIHHPGIILYKKWERAQHK